jgi:hypothetical protein
MFGRNRSATLLAVTVGTAALALSLAACSGSSTAAPAASASSAAPSSVASSMAALSAAAPSVSAAPTSSAPVAANSPAASHGGAANATTVSVACVMTPDRVRATIQAQQVTGNATITSIRCAGEYAMVKTVVSQGDGGLYLLKWGQSTQRWLKLQYGSGWDCAEQAPASIAVALGCSNPAPAGVTGCPVTADVLTAAMQPFLSGQSVSKVDCHGEFAVAAVNPGPVPADPGWVVFKYSYPDKKWFYLFNGSANFCDAIPAATAPQFAICHG